MPASHAEERPVDRRLDELPRWLVGDWGRWIRDPLDLLRLALLVGAPITLAFGPREQAFRLVLTFLLVLIPRAMAVPRPFDLLFVAGMSLQAWGNVAGAFDGIYGYDKVVHFVLPAATAPLLYLLLVRIEIVPDLSEETGLHNLLAMVLITFCVGISLAGGLYEMYEWFANRYLGAHLYVSYGDSIGDLTDDGLGALVGGALLMLWDRAGWGSRRRRPRRDADLPDDPVEEAGQWIVARVQPDARTARRGAHTAAPPRWAPALTVVADVLRLTFAAGVVWALAHGHWEEAARFLITLGAALAPRLLRAPRPFDLVFALAMAAQAWGDVTNAYAALPGYDQATRLIVSIGAASVLYLGLVRLRALPDFAAETGIRERLAILLTGFCFGFAAGILYELYVWFADHALDAGLAVTYDELIARLALDAIGALIGGLLLVVWDVYGWGSARA
jgi:hypothetical protein